MLRGEFHGVPPWNSPRNILVRRRPTVLGCGHLYFLAFFPNPPLTLTLFFPLFFPVHSPKKSGQGCGRGVDGFRDLFTRPLLKVNVWTRRRPTIEQQPTTIVQQSNNNRTTIKQQSNNNRTTIDNNQTIKHFRNQTTIERRTTIEQQSNNNRTTVKQQSNNGQTTVEQQSNDNRQSNNNRTTIIHIMMYETHDEQSCHRGRSLVVHRWVSYVAS